MYSIASAGRILIALYFVLFSVSVMSQERPSLADEIRQVVESQGPEAAKARFNELFPAQQDRYDVDMQGMAGLGQEYMMAGDMEKGMAIMEMASQIAAEMANQMNADLNRNMAGQTPESAEIMRQMQEQERQAQAARAEEEAMARREEQARQQKAERQSRGKSRSDLSRFAGLYTDPADANRTLFVTESCDGYLVAGPMWADVGPWWMRSAADTVFTYADSFMNFSVEFKADGSGNITSMAHEIEGIGSPVKRSGDLPADWGMCMEPPRR